MVNAQRVDYEIKANDSALRKVAEVTNGYDIIGIGESAHGVSEFRAWEFSFIKFLINRGRLKGVVIEDNFSKISKLNDYIQGSENPADLNHLTSGLYNIWQSDELVKLIHFMHDYNQKQKDKKNLVYFVGADMQDASGVYDAINFLKENGISNASITERDLELVTGLGKGRKYNFKRLPEADKERISKTIGNLRLSFDSLSKIPEFDTTKDFKYAYHGFDIVDQCFENEKAGILKWIKFRNKCLAKNVFWVNDFLGKGKQVVFLAHNGHLSNLTHKELKKRNLSYYSIFEDFMSGSIVNSYSLEKSNITIKDGDNLLGNYFTRQSGQVFFVDFTNPDFKHSALAKYIRKNGKVHNFGVDNTGTMKVNPIKTCSGIVIFRKVNSFLGK